jgi:hypothetical protein
MALVVLLVLVAVFVLSAIGYLVHPENRTAPLSA